MYLAEITHSFTVSEVVGVESIFIILFCLFYSLGFSTCAIIKSNYRLLITPPIISVSSALWITGGAVYSYGLDLYRLGFDLIDIDPSFEMVNVGSLFTTIGISCLLLCVTSSIFCFSYLVIQFRRRKQG